MLRLRGRKRDYFCLCVFFFIGRKQLNLFLSSCFSALFSFSFPSIIHLSSPLLIAAHLTWLVMNLRNPFVLITLPLAFAFGLVWFRRKKVHCDTGGDEDLPEKSSARKNSTEPNKKSSEEDRLRPAFEHSVSLPIESTPIKKNSLTPGNNNDSFDFKFGKSAPIDITPQKTSPSRMKNSGDRTSADNNCSKSIEFNSIEEHSFDSIDLPGSIDRRFSATNIVRSREPAVVVKANKMVNNNSPQSSFEVVSQTPSPPPAPQPQPPSSKPNETSRSEKPKQKEAKKLEVNVNNEPSQNGAPARSLPVSSPPLSLCSNKSNQSHDSADSGKGSSPPNSVADGPNESAQFIRDFELSQFHVGYVIGRNGQTVRDILSRSGVTIDFRRHPLKNKKLKLITLHGTQKQIDSALAIINSKLPPRVELTPIDLDLDSAATLSNASINFNLLQLNLIDGINNDVIVSTVQSADTIFLQQPLHPSYPYLNLLQKCLNQSYSVAMAPSLPNCNVDTICVGRVDEHWYRLQIIDSPTDDECIAKYLDYGGYCRANKTDLRQIRTDFMTIPFQAIETRLADIKPKGNHRSSMRRTFCSAALFRL